jgi:hypothetical protein
MNNVMIKPPARKSGTLFYYNPNIDSFKSMNSSIMCNPGATGLKRVVCMCGQVAAARLT